MTSKSTSSLKSSFAGNALTNLKDLTVVGLLRKSKISFFSCSVREASNFPVVKLYNISPVELSIKNSFWRTYLWVLEGDRYSGTHRISLPSLVSKYSLINSAIAKFLTSAFFATVNGLYILWFSI